MVHLLPQLAMYGGCPFGHDKMYFFVTVFGRGVAGMPLPRKPRVILHGSARTETGSPRVTVGAGNVASTLCQIVNPGLPCMVLAAFMGAA
jgi:hypothetical protein